MREFYFHLFHVTLVIAIPDGTDGWLWRSEFGPEKNRHTHISFIALRFVESRTGWVGIEFIFFPLALLLKWEREKSYPD